MSKISKDSLRIPIRSEYLFLLFPLNFVYGYWQMPITVLFIMFVFILKDKILLEKSNIIFPNLFVWLINILWGLYILFKSQVFREGLDYYLVLFLSPFLLFVLLHNIKTDIVFFERFFNIIIISGLILSFFSFINLSIADFDFTKRIYSTWPDLNILAGYYLVVFMILVSFVMNEKKRKQKIFYFISLFILLFAIFLTQTRGVWLSIIFAIIIYMFKSPKLLIPISILILALSLLFADIIMARFLTIKNFSEDLSSIGRLQAWIGTLALLKTNYLTGYGFNSFLYLRDNVYGFYLVPVIHSHNTYLNNILEMGLIGSTIYYSFYVRAIYYAFRYGKVSFNNQYKKYADGLFLSLIGFLVAFFFEPYFSIFSSSAIVLWLLIGISFKLNFIINKKEDNYS